MLSRNMQINLIKLRLLDVASNLRVMGASGKDLLSIQLGYAEQVASLIGNDKAFEGWVHKAFGVNLGNKLMEKERSLKEMVALVNDTKDRAVEMLRSKGIKVKVI